jgi:hypothetical protein
MDGALASLPVESCLAYGSTTFAPNGPESRVSRSTRPAIPGTYARKSEAAQLYTELARMGSAALPAAKNPLELRQ